MVSIFLKSRVYQNCTLYNVQCRNIIRTGRFRTGRFRTVNMYSAELILRTFHYKKVICFAKINLLCTRYIVPVLIQLTWLFTKHCLALNLEIFLLELLDSNLEHILCLRSEYELRTNLARTRLNNF